MDHRNKERRSIGVKGLLVAASVFLAPLALAACQTEMASDPTPAAQTEAAEMRPATRAEIERIAVGRTINGAMTYNADGTYLFRGGSPGRYTISDGRICVNFDSGGRRCDRIVTDGESFTMINRNGRRFPFG